MIDWLFILILFIALLFFFKSIEYRTYPFWGAVLTILDIVLWFILAITSYNIHTVTYTKFDQITGNFTIGIKPFYDIDTIYFSYFFYLMAIIMIIYLVAYFMFSSLINIKK